MTPQDRQHEPEMTIPKILELSARAWDRFMIALSEDRAPNEALRRAAGRRIRHTA